MDKNCIDQETYEALKVLLDYCHHSTDAEGVFADELEIVGKWMTAVEQEIE